MLREFVDSEARNFTGERFNRFALEMNQRIKSLIRRSEGVRSVLVKQDAAGWSAPLGVASQG